MHVPWWLRDVPIVQNISKHQWTSVVLAWNHFLCIDAFDVSSSSSLVHNIHAVATAIYVGNSNPLTGGYRDDYCVVSERGTTGTRMLHNYIHQAHANF